MEGGTIARLGSRLTFQNEERKKMRKKLLFSLITLGISFMVLTGCSNSANKTTTESSAATKILKDPYSDEQFLLGTYVRIRVYDEGKESALKPAFDRVKELGDKITINQKGSEIDEVNEQAGIKPVKVSDDVYTLVKRAYEYSQDSQGGFDMAIGAITQLWRIGFDDARKPSQEEIDQALKLVDYHKIELNDKEKKDIAIQAEELIEGLTNGENLNFYGEPATQDQKDRLLIAIRTAMEMNKEEAKKKFTRKDYRN